MRLLHKGSAPAFQAGGESSILSRRTILLVLFLTGCTTPSEYVEAERLCKEQGYGRPALLGHNKEDALVVYCNL